MTKGITVANKEDRKEIETLDNKVKYVTGLTIRICFTIFFLYGVYKIGWVIAL